MSIFCFVVSMERPRISAFFAERLSAESIPVMEVTVAFISEERFLSCALIADKAVLNSFSPSTPMRMPISFATLVTSDPVIS